MNPEHHLYATNRLAAINALIKLQGQDFKALQCEQHILREFLGFQQTKLMDSISTMVSEITIKAKSKAESKPVGCKLTDGTGYVLAATDTSTGFLHITSTSFDPDYALRSLEHDPAKRITLKMATLEAARSLAGSWHRAFSAQRVTHPNNPRYFYPADLRRTFAAIIAYGEGQLGIVSGEGLVPDHGLRASRLDLDPGVPWTDRHSLIIAEYTSLVTG